MGNRLLYPYSSDWLLVSAHQGLAYYLQAISVSTGNVKRVSMSGGKKTENDVQFNTVYLLGQSWAFLLVAH